ncbi:hypothetical protein V5799_031282 [Amblyomma americanum]|uniref:Uncharacterized protein n=1 Tax=Amblyomma americanum TaxID=6943 RepID=A0AAQ4EKV3_AMBAM
MRTSCTTLFVVNLSPYCNEDCLKRAFGNCGKVAKVWLQKTPSSGKPSGNTPSFYPSAPSVTGFKVALVFQKEASVHKALTLSVSESRVLFHEGSDDVVGMAKWCNEEYQSRFVNAEEVQKEVDAYMEDYDARLEEEKERAKAMEGVPDKKGWITVTKYGKRPVIPRNDAVNQKIASAEKKKHAQKELPNFYTFLVRESKMKRTAELHKKFEEDKRRISLMKASRHFRPV